MAHRHSRPPHVHENVTAKVDSILELLRADGGRVTTGRRAIVTALLAGPDHHVTAEDVARLVQADHPDVHLSTIYRTLEALEQQGVLDRVNLGTGGAVYHLTDHAHHHLVCDHCGTVVEVPAAAFAELARDLHDAYGFQTAASHLAISGRCDRCRE